MNRVRLLLTMLFLSMPGVMFGQNVTFEAAQLTNLMIENNWSTIQNMLNAMEPGLAIQLEKGGATKEASKVLMEEIVRNFNKENVARGFAKVVSEEFSITETRQLLEFMKSPLGEKYRKIFESEKVGLALLSFTLKEACAGANAKLGFFERGSIHSTCRNF